MKREEMRAVALDAEESGYRNSLALRLATICTLGEDSESVARCKVEEFVETPFSLQYIIGEESSPVGVAIASRDSIYLGFFGSKTRRDWLRNFDVRFSPWFVGWVHRGFLKTSLDIIPAVMSSLDPVYSPHKEVFLCGHSRGGAIAAILAVFLDMHGYRVDWIYSFGSPKPGDASFSKYFHDRWPGRTMTVHNADDLVMHFPPSLGEVWIFLALLARVVLWLMLVILLPAGGLLLLVIAAGRLASPLVVEVLNWVF